MLGAVSTGAVVSRTVILNDAYALLPALSVAAMSTVVVPSGKVLPEGSAHVTVTGLLTVSSADGQVNVATAPAGLVASSTWLAGMAEVKKGGVVSRTRIVKLVVA